MSFLKYLIKLLSFIYFKVYEKSKNEYISSSGKVILKDDVDNLVESLLDFNFTIGRFNSQFEENLSKIIGKKYCITTNSGSSANLLAVTALMSYKLGEKKLKPGNEVITLAAGFPTTIAPIIQNGLIPVFIDINIPDYNADLRSLEKFINQNTKAVFFPHSLGNPFKVDEIVELCKKHNLFLIEDNCDALGSVYDNQMTGSFGEISTFSFYPAHQITTGEGGALLTDDETIYKTLLSLRDWGRDCHCLPGKDNTCKKRFETDFKNLPAGFDHKYIYSQLGYNLRMTDIQAALGVSQLSKIKIFTEKRKENFKFLYDGLKQFENFFIFPKALEKSSPSWFGFPLTLKENIGFNRIDLVKYLENHNIATRLIFSGNILRHPVFASNNYLIKIEDSEILDSSTLNENHFSKLPNTEIVLKKSFWVGLWHGLDKKDILHTVEVFSNFIDFYGKQR